MRHGVQITIDVQAANPKSEFARHYLELKGFEAREQHEIAERRWRRAQTGVGRRWRKLKQLTAEFFARRGQKMKMDADGVG